MPSVFFMSTTSWLSRVVDPFGWLRRAEQADHIVRMMGAAGPNLAADDSQPPSVLVARQLAAKRSEPEFGSLCRYRTCNRL